MVIICRVVARAVTPILGGYYLLNPITSCTVLASGAPSSAGLQYRALYKQPSWPFFHNRLDLSTKQFISKMSQCPSRSGLECVHCRFPVLTVWLVIEQRLRISAAASSGLSPTDGIKLATDATAENSDIPLGYQRFLILTSHLPAEASYS